MGLRIHHSLAMSFDKVKVNDGDGTFSKLSQERNKGMALRAHATSFLRLFGGRETNDVCVQSGVVVGLWNLIVCLE